MAKLRLRLLRPPTSRPSETRNGQGSHQRTPGVQRLHHAKICRTNRPGISTMVTEESTGDLLHPEPQYQISQQ